MAALARRELHVDAVKGSISLCVCVCIQALPRLAPLLRVDEYREAVLEGMVACIGGLDGHLSKQASAAIVQQTRGADADTAGETQKHAHP